MTAYGYKNQDTARHVRRTFEEDSGLDCLQNIYTTYTMMSPQTIKLLLFLVWRAAQNRGLRPF